MGKKSSAPTEKIKKNSNTCPRSHAARSLVAACRSFFFTTFCKVDLILLKLTVYKSGSSLACQPQLNFSSSFSPTSSSSVNKLQNFQFPLAGVSLVSLFTLSPFLSLCVGFFPFPLNLEKKAKDPSGSRTGNEKKYPATKRVTLSLQRPF